MNATATLKQNSGYIERFISWFRMGMKPTEAKFRGYAYTFSTKGNHCTIGYHALGEKLGMSKSSTWRAVAHEKKHDVVSVQRNGGKNSTYTYVGDLPHEMRIRTELFFYTELFNIHGQTRSLTDAEVDVLSLIYTCTRYRNKYEGNYGDIARLLGLNYATVRRAVAALFAAKLISRPKKGANNNDKSVYVAKQKRIHDLQKANEKQAKRAESKQAKYIRETDARIEAKRSEELLREKARRLSDNARERLRTDVRGNAVHVRLGRLGYEIAKAETSSPAELPALLREEKMLRIEYDQILQKLDLEEWMLDSDAQLQRLQKARHRIKGGGEA